MEARKEGWAQPAKARKSHYFRNGMSLCGKWAYVGGNLDPATYVRPQPGDCVTCWRKAYQELEI